MRTPIGIFDSGYGGLTVMKEIASLMPQYDYIYLGDNARAPYGPLDFDTVYKYTLQCVKWFFLRGCPLVILACNTASAKALRTIQQKDLQGMDSKKRVLGVIRPTTEIIGKLTQIAHIGIMATTGTVLSNSYVIEINKFYPELQVSQEACPEWVSLVEEGLYDTAEANEPVKKHIDNLMQKDKKIDSILLACTHYPLLINKIKEFVPFDINIISQEKIVAESLEEYLKNHSEMENACSKNGTIKFFTTGNVTNFDEHASIFFGKNVHASHINL